MTDDLEAYERINASFGSRYNYKASRLSWEMYAASCAALLLFALAAAVLLHDAAYEPPGIGEEGRIATLGLGIPGLMCLLLALYWRTKLREYR